MAGARAQSFGAKRRRLLAAAMGLAAGLIAGSAWASGADRVRTVDGVVEGLGPQASGVRIFRGIPFAAPPVGPLRWKAPQPAKRWPGVREAKAFGPRCMQAPIYSDMVFRSAGVSEDCLYLNVWSPAKSARARLPVLVYFYGGGFNAGDGSEPRYDGEAMAAKGVVVVTLSYRLGVFGFFSHPELSAESAGGGSGNQGLLDQTAALRWVRSNIAAFGGDPARVTIAGESAGSVSVSAQMASPEAKGLFARAIGESGSLLGTLPAQTLAEAEAKGTTFGAGVGAKSLAELRAMPAQALLDAAVKPDAFHTSPVVDGRFLPKSPREIYEAGEQSRVPLLAGSNNEELVAQALLGKWSPTVEVYRAAVQKLYGDKAEAVLAAYPASADGEPVLQAARDLESDRFIALSTWRWMDLATRTGGQPTFYYSFAQPRPALKADPAAARPAGAVHAGEIEYVLGNLDLNPIYAWTDQDRTASRLAQDYFANFIKSGDPNAEGLPEWPRYGTGLVMRLDPNPKAEPDTAVSRRKALEAATPR